MTYDAKRYASNVVERIRLGGEDSVALVEGAIRGGYEAGRAERPALHPTTRAMLAAMREAYRDASLGHHAARARREWVAAGCPDAEEEP